MEWYPRNPRDFDLATLGWSLAERGAYSCLIDAYYANEGPLPDDDKALAALLRVSVEEWQNLAGNLRVKFSETQGFLVHKRCEEELEKQRKIAAISRKNGKKGGRPKRKKNKDINPEKTQGVTQAGTQKKPQDITLQNNITDTIVSSVSTHSGPDIDWRGVLFGESIEWVSAETGKPISRLRPMLGKWLSMTGSDARAVVDAINAARAARVADPVGWVNAYLGGKKKGQPASVMGAIGRG